MNDDIYGIHWNYDTKCDCDFWFNINVLDKCINCHAKKIGRSKVKIYILWEIIRENPMDSLQDMYSMKAIEQIDDYSTRNMFEYTIMKGFPIKNVPDGWPTFEFVWEKDPAKHERI